MVSQADLDRFYENLVTSIRADGALCAITSGMACVRYNVAHSTKDCDVLCATESAELFLNRLVQTVFEGASCSYRGHLTPNGTYFRRHLSSVRRLRQRMTSWKGVNLAWRRE